MKNLIKLSVLFICLLFKYTSFAQVEIMRGVDNWRYWQELAELGLVQMNPVVEVPEAVFRGNEIVTPFATAISPDVLTVGGSGVVESENSIFVSPVNTQVVFNSNNTKVNNINIGVNASFSFNGGQSWSNGTSGSGVPTNGGDPAVVINNNGLAAVGYISGLTFGQGQGISTTSDNGITWTGNHVGPTNTGSINSGGFLLDKNHLWIDNSPFMSNGLPNTPNPYYGNLYSGWTLFRQSNFNNHRIQISKSSNNGLSWSNEWSLGGNINGVFLHQGVNLQTGPNGEVYAVWTMYDVDGGRESRMGFSKSTDGGLSFSQAVEMPINVRGIRWKHDWSATTGLTNVTGKDMAVNSFPCMAVDISGGVNNGTIYVVWANYGDPGNNNQGNDISIYFTKSTNGGVGWSDPIRVNQDPLGNVQYFPWITCDPVTGDLSVIFYDDRNVGGADLETWVAVSTNGGGSWYDFRVSDVSFTPSPIPGYGNDYMGDYIGISARGGMVYPVWTDNRTDTCRSYCSPFILGCPYDLNITMPVLSGNTDHQEALNTITATNVVSQGSEAVYHAGTEVLLPDGFIAEGGSEYRAHIDICNGSFIKSAPYDPNEPLVKSEKPKPVEYFKPNDKNIKLSISPNPTQGIFEIVLPDGIKVETFDLKIYSMSGGIAYKNRFDENEINRFQVDISKFKSGVYFFEMTDSKNKSTYTGKVVKM